MSDNGQPDATWTVAQIRDHYKTWPDIPGLERPNSGAKKSVHLAYIGDYRARIDGASAKTAPWYSRAWAWLVDKAIAPLIQSTVMTVIAFFMWLTSYYGLVSGWGLVAVLAVVFVVTLWWQRGTRKKFEHSLKKGGDHA